MEPIDAGLSIRRYINWRAFVNLVEKNELELKNCTYYQTFDPLEGKITKAFEDVMRRGQILKSKLNTDPDSGVIFTDDEILALNLINFEIYRQHSYISSWTYSENENLDMWKTYASAGVIIESTVGLVRDQIYNYADDNDFMVSDGHIKYNRENMHKSLTFSDYDNFDVGIFNLDGLGGDDYNTFKHEMEYRFVLRDTKSIQEEQDISAYADIKSGQKYQVEQINRQISITFEINSVLKIIFSNSAYKNGSKLLENNGIEIPYSISSLY